ncbi:MAG: BatA domain-containing protein [Planctomycetota bacterium]
MDFAQPQGLWLAGATAFVLLTYLVRRRARRVEVPFLGLWAGALSERRGGFGGALTRWFDLLLALLAAVAVGLASGSPYVPGAESTVRDLVLVIDGGVELRARGRAERLERVAAAEVVRRAPGTRIVVVRVEPGGPRLHIGTSRRNALDFLRDHRPGWQTADPVPACELAREAARELREPDLVFCTYRRARPDGFRLRTIREAAPNAGFVGVEVLGDPEGGGRLARVTLRGDGEVSIGDRWSGTVEGERTVDLPLGEDGEITLQLKARGDAFPVDDRLYLHLPERKRPRVLVVAPREPSPFLVSAMRALEETGTIREPLDRTVPERVGEVLEIYDVVVFDRCAPATEFAGMRAIYIAPPEGALPFQLGTTMEAPALFDVKEAHPLLAGTGLGRLPPLEARAIRGGEALALSAAGPVVATGPGWVALGYDPEKCVLASSPAYPLFLRNAILALAGDAPVRTTEFVRIGERAAVTQLMQAPDRTRRSIGARWDGPPGFWRRDEFVVAVNFLERDIDLEPAEADSDELPAVGKPAQPDFPLAPPFAAGAFVLLLVGWWWFWR